MGLGSPGGGMSMGEARGRITLDISQLEAAARHALALGRSFEQALSGVDSAARRSRSSFQGIVDGIGSVRTELTALSVGSGLLAGFGLSGARNLRNYNIAFRQFVGSQEEASKLTERLIDQANRYGLEWQGVVQLGRALIPSLKEGAKDLDGWIGRAARLRSLFPNAPTGSETIAINEFLAGQAISLQRRFNIPANLIQEAAEKFQDVGEQLDYILERRGATEEAAVAMADAFVGVRNELHLLLSEGFAPLFQQLQPMLAGFREWVSAVREGNPELANLSAGLIAVTAVGAPALLLFERLVVSAQKLKQLGVLGALGRGGVLAGAAVGGGVAGLGISRAIGRATGNESMANADWQSVWETFKKLLFNVTTNLVRFLQNAIGVWANTVNSFGKGVDTMLNAMARFVRGVASLLPANLGGNSLLRGAAQLEGAVGSRGGSAALNLSEQFNRTSNQFLLDWARSIQQGGGGGALDNALGGSGGGAEAGNETNPNAAIIHEWAMNVQRIEREAARARLDATEQFEQQRTDAITQHERTIARDAEDFARQRQRQAEQLERQIADIHENAAERDAEATADHEERVADLRDDTNERLQKLDEEYQRNRERAANDHRDRLLSAAARLDAVAVRDEQKRYANQQRDAQENYEEQRSETQDALAKRLADERESHEERRQEQRMADAERIQDLRDNLAEQQQLEDEDRAIAAQRRDEDFQRQLQQQATAHAERLAQIDRQAAEERTQLDEAFLLQLQEAGKYSEGWLKMQEARQDASLKLFDAWWDGIERRFAIQGPQPRPIGPQPASFPTDFLGGSAVPAQFPTNFIVPGQSSNRSVNIEEGAIVVYGAPGQNEAQIGQIVRDEMIGLLEGVQQ